MEIVYRKLVDLKPHPDNPRKVKEENSIAEFAEKIRTNPKHFEARPILLSNRTGELVIIGGERRWESAAYLGWESAPTILIEGLTEDEETRILFEDNTHTGVWDEKKLAQWDKKKLQGWGVELPSWEKQKKETKQVVEDDFDSGKKVKARCKLGELWQLGKHRLLCGDSTNQLDIEKLMGGATIDLVFTDPPYGNGTSGKYGRGQLGVRTILGDEDISVFQKFINIMPCDKLIYFLQWRTIVESFEIVKDKGLKINTVGVWDKKNAGLNGGGGISEQWEAIIFCGNIKYAKFGGNVFTISREHNARVNSLHPHQKPIQLLADILDFIANANKILDAFGGSGSTLIACEQLQKQCYTMEYDPHYCDVIIDRWEKYTGLKAVKIE